VLGGPSTRREPREAGGHPRGQHQLGHTHNQGDEEQTVPNGHLVRAVRCGTNRHKEHMDAGPVFGPPTPSQPAGANRVVRQTRMPAMMMPPNPVRTRLKDVQHPQGHRGVWLDRVLSGPKGKPASRGFSNLCRPTAAGCSVRKERLATPGGAYPTWRPAAQGAGPRCGKPRAISGPTTPCRHTLSRPARDWSHRAHLRIGRHPSPRG
jgi:hypothetical protein